MTKKRIFMTLGAVALIGLGVTFATNRSQTASADCGADGDGPGHTGHALVGD